MPRAKVTVLAAVAASATVLPLVVVSQAQAAAPAPASAATVSVHRVTLVTGDVVTVSRLADGRQASAVDPADMTGDGVRSVTIGTDQYVFPAAALPFVADGSLDRELFNVTALVDQGYSDDERGTLPLIVQYSSEKARASAPAPDGAVRTRTLESIDAAAVTAHKEEAETFWTDVTGTPPSEVEDEPALTGHIEKIWLDGRVRADLSDSVAQVGAPEAWAAGYDGSGVKVAVLDTGIDEQHPDVAGQVAEQKSFVPDGSTKDVVGHGTHVASTVLGTGAASGGTEKGVAPGARLLVGKVLGDDGFGEDSWIIDGMEWAAAHADVVSMSLGSTEASDGQDPMSLALNSLSESTGALFVVAAGNNGAEGTIGSPGAAQDALTVGAVDGTDQLAYFSSMGPRIGDQGLKPDITAPGVDILAARSQYMSEGEGSYVTMSGTSMATPHVAGAAAILAQRHPTWTAPQLKDALMSSARELAGYSPYQVGTGRLDVPAALRELRATGSAFLGFDRWPHPDTTPLSTTVTYTNDGDASVDLTLATEVSDATGTPAPDGTFTLSQPTVTVPAHGSTDVTVTVDRGLTADGTRFAGTLKATDGTTSLRTSIGYVRENEQYDLTLTLKDRKGKPAQGWVELVGGPMGYEPIPVDGSLTIRRPAGTYSAMVFLEADKDTDQAGMVLLGNPEVRLTRDRTVVMDARKAREVTATVPGRRTEATFTRMGWYRQIDGWPVDSELVMPVWVRHVYAAPTAAVRTGEFELNTRWRLRQPLLTVRSGGQDLPVLTQPGGPLLTGKASLDVVAAGTGAPSDYEGLDVAGKVALVTRSDAVSAYDRAVAAREAGASLLLVVNDAPTILNEWVGGPMGEDPGIPVATLSAGEGAALLDRATHGAVRATVIGRPNSAWVYDLQDPHPGRIPNDLRYVARQRDLATVSAEYASDRPADGGEFRWDFRPYTFAGIGFLQILSVPSTRTEWVSTPEGSSWYQEAVIIEPFWDVRSTRVVMHAGQRTTARWFSPVVRPRIGEGYWRPDRQGGYMQLNLPAWADSGPGHTGDMYFSTGSTQHITLYAPDGSVLEDRDDQAVWVTDLPTGKGRFRVVTTAERDPDRWSTSTRTRTDWRFWSRDNDGTPRELPLLSLDYGVATDLAGRVAAGPTRLTLSAVQIAGADLAGTVAGARLWASYDDGTSWRRVTLHRTGTGSWTMTIPQQASASGTLSLRAKAWDTKGNSITQEVIRAYRLP
jgi:subtilisin family serine protease